MSRSTFSHVRVTGITAVVPERCIDIDDEIILVVGAGADTDSLWEAVEEYNKTMLQSQQIADIVEFGRPLPRTLTGKIRRYELQRRYQ